LKQKSKSCVLLVCYTTTWNLVMFIHRATTKLSSWRTKCICIFGITTL